MSRAKPGRRSPHRERQVRAAWSRRLEARRVARRVIRERQRYWLGVAAALASGRTLPVLRYWDACVPVWRPAQSDSRAWPLPDATVAFGTSRLVVHELENTAVSLTRTLEPVLVLRCGRRGPARARVWEVRLIPGRPASAWRDVLAWAVGDQLAAAYGGTALAPLPGDARLLDVLAEGPRDLREVVLRHPEALARVATWATSRVGGEPGGLSGRMQ
ncbi:MAG TPA: hypothetical protein VFS33_05750 [Gemmatimonadales bacterium]|nr:hypothetical protein [Gemmatimonadales bacterium]